MGWSNYYDRFPRYVSVAERQRNAQRELAKMAKKGFVAQPIKTEGRNIAESFWGVAWCDNLESYMDYANRLPRGRSYLRNGSVVHLDLAPGKIEAFVCGSEMYKVKIQIRPAAKKKWEELCRSCAGGIGSLVELLQGRLSEHVMKLVTHRSTGLFPSPAEIDMDCSCPDAAGMCKHIAAVLYGVGARLDKSPELLFSLRSVNHEDLIQQAASVTALTNKGAGSGEELAESDLSAVFGIELDTEAVGTKGTTPMSLKESAPPGVVADAPRPVKARKPGKATTPKAPAGPKKSAASTEKKPALSRRRLSPAARERIAAAVRARWAKAKRAQQ